MPTHLYCLLPSGSDVSPPSAAPPIRILEIGEVVAWVGDSSGDRLPRDTNRAAVEAVEHDRVIGHALASGVTPVPASLADPYASDANARTDIERRITEIRSSLAMIAGNLEMATIIAVGTVPVISSGSSAGSGRGRAYLEHLRDLPARATAIADSVERRVEKIALASSRRAEGGRVGLSHLVNRNQVDAYRTAALGVMAEGHRILVDGPRAPYSFAAFSPQRPGTEAGPIPPTGSPD